MNKFKRTLVGLVSLLTLGAVSLTGTTNVQAAKEANGAGQPAFSVQAVLPKDNAKGSSYFDFKVKPGETRKLSIKVSNKGKQEATFDVKPNNAVTNENAIIDYTKGGQKDGNAQVAISDMISDYDKGQQVTIPAKSEKTVTFTLKAPRTAFNGVALGGFLIAPHDAVKNALAENNKSDTPKTIVSTFQYVVALKVSENDRKVEPEIKFNKATYAVKHGLASVIVDMENTAPALEGATGTVKITKDGSKEAVYDRKVTNLSFAPASSWGWMLSFGTKTLEAGDYKIAIHLIGASGNHYDYETTLKVTEKDAAEVKKNAADFTPKPKTDYTWVWIVSIVGGILLALLIIYIIASKRKQKENEEKIKAQALEDAKKELEKKDDK